MTFKEGGPKGRPFSFYVFVFFLTLILVMSGVITVIDYIATKETFDAHVIQLGDQTEQYVIRVLTISDSADKTFDSLLNDRAKTALSRLHDEYVSAGRDPVSIDFAQLKEELGGETDLYVIDEGAVIRYTSYPNDIGLNFSSTAPSLAKYLKEIRMKQGFFPDRVAREFATGKFRKFAYMPTDDHRFVLETGITGSLLEGEYISLRPNDTELVAEITEFNPALVDVEFFPIAALKVHNPELLPDPEEKVLLDQLARERKSTTIIDTQNDRIARYLYVYLNDPTYGSDMSVIVRLTYNTALTTQALNRLLLANLIKILFVLAFSAVFAVLISRRVSRPVEGIVEDVDRIARGDLTHQVATSKVREFIHLGWHIDAMVQRLRETIQKIETRERDLMQSEERYRAVVETQTEMICRFAPDGTHLFVNEAYCRYFGRQCEEIVGHRFIPNIPPEELDLVVHHFGSLTQRAPVGTIEHRIILPDGTVRWQQWVDRALFADNGSVLEYQSVGRDITERKHAESALRQANIKLNVLTSLVRNEIQSGLFILRGYLYLLGQEGMNDHDQPVLEKAKEVSIRMNDLIQFSRSYIDLGSQPPSWQGVHQTIIYAISHLPTKGIRHRIACENIEIYADPFLERAAFRLASRSQLHEPTHVIAVSCIKRGGNLDIIWEDNGPGIPSAEKIGLFNPPVTFSGSSNLFFVREILSITGISIIEEGDPAGGARFRITVPSGIYRSLPDDSPGSSRPL